jgi:hypothetical protein
MLTALIFALPQAVFAQKTTKTNTTISTKQTTVSESEISGGLKEALGKGVTKAVKELGKEDGFLNNAKVKIPLPKQLQTIEKGLRVAGQGKIADEFVETMNHAAEKAVSESLPIFTNSLKQMTLQDARTILTSGESDSATQFFRRTSEAQLRDKFMPIVKKFTEETGVTAQYKQLTAKAGFLTALNGKNKLDIDEYVTGKAMDGLFLLIAEEEKNIRQNPLGRTTDLLRKVFGIGKK